MPLGVRPIVIPDESRYAEIPREMIASGDWIVPHLDGFRYFEKPVLGYWITATSMMLFGENAFAIRLPSALAAGFSALLLFLLVWKRGGGYAAGLLAATVFLTCLEVLGIGTFNVLDGQVSLFMSASMGAFFFAYTEKNSVKKNGFLILSGIFAGLAFLTKGFIAFAVPLAAIVPFMIWERRWKEILGMMWIPAVAACLVSLPWAVMIAIREPDFWHFFFWNEHIKRFIADNAQHKETAWYFFLVLPGALLPWTFLLPAVVSGWKQTDFQKPLIRFAVCWFLFPFLFFSASNGKLLTYILPCFPPLAILMEMGLRHYVTREKLTTFTRGASLFTMVLIITAVALAVFQIVGFQGIRPYGQTWKWGLAVAGLLFWTLCLLFSVREPGYQKKITFYCAAPLLFMFCVPFLVPDQTIERKMPGEFLLRNSHKVVADSILVSDEEPLRAVCWFYRRSDVNLIEGTGELSYGINNEDSKHRQLDLDGLRELVLQNRGTGRVILIAATEKYKIWRNKLPPPLFEDSNGDNGFVFAQF
jgi:4-amino-4-deoxy-L-arabinose transferase